MTDPFPRKRLSRKEGRRIRSVAVSTSTLVFYSRDEDPKENRVYDARLQGNLPPLFVSFSALDRRLDESSHLYR